MNPEIAAAWRDIRIGLANVQGNLSDHQRLQAAAAVIEAALTPPEKKPAPAAPPAGKP